LTRRGKTSVPAKNKPSQDPRKISILGGKMGKKIVYTGLIVLCALGFLLSYANADSQENASVEFRMVCAGVGQTDCHKAAMLDNYEELYVTNSPFLSTKDIGSAKIREQEAANTPGVIIDVQFNKEGIQKFNEITSKYGGRRMAIFIDGKLQDTPKIYDPVTTGKTTIASKLTKEEAKVLVDHINKRPLKK